MTLHCQQSYRTYAAQINEQQRGNASKRAVVVTPNLNLTDLMLFRINQAALMRDISDVRDNISGSI